MFVETGEHPLHRGAEEGLVVDRLEGHPADMTGHLPVEPGPATTFARRPCQQAGDGNQKEEDEIAFRHGGKRHGAGMIETVF